MHATTQNVFGVHTEYGTHPRQPRRLGRHLRRVGAASAKAIAIGALAAWYLARH